MALSNETLTLIERKTGKKANRFLRGPLTFTWIAVNIPDPTSRLIMIGQAFMDMKGSNEIPLTAEIWDAARIKGKDARHRVVKNVQAGTGDFIIVTRPGRTSVLQNKSLK